MRRRRADSAKTISLHHQIVGGDLITIRMLHDPLTMSDPITYIIHHQKTQQTQDVESMFV